MTAFQCQIEIIETYFQEEHIAFSAEEEFQDLSSLTEIIDATIYSYNVENFRSNLEQTSDTFDDSCEKIDIGLTITLYFDEGEAVLLRIPFDYEEMSLTLNQITVEGDLNDPIARGLFGRYNLNGTL